MDLWFKGRTGDNLHGFGVGAVYSDVDQIAAAIRDKPVPMKQHLRGEGVFEALGS